MHVVDAIRTMHESAGMSARELSRALGKSANYVSSRLNSRAGYGMSTLARICTLCGYDLVAASDRGEAVIPPDGDARDAIRGALSASGLSARAASLALGRSGDYVYSVLAREHDTSCATVADILGACGYELVARRAEGSERYAITSER